MTGHTLRHERVWVTILSPTSTTLPITNNYVLVESFARRFR